ncbi:hypothetical protein HDU78_005873 [Chytriomyces hyalinus]|nr:hypothetical protein HDU78_005873 [Chytriomyces hyalinus]
MVKSQVIVVAGANGQLGALLVESLLDRADAENKAILVRCLVRDGRGRDPILKGFKRSNPDEVEIVEVDYDSESDVERALAGAHCVVSVLQGLRGVVVGVQETMLKCAIKCKVKRFIPSDFSIDFTRFPNGYNRNLDWRREFHSIADKMITDAKADMDFTSIYNGAFMELLGGAFLVRYKQKEIAYFGSSTHKMDFTTYKNTADYTAAVCMDTGRTPKCLHIAGSQTSPKELQEIASSVTGVRHRLVWMMVPYWLLLVIIWVLKVMIPYDEEDVTPIWQKFQYAYCFKFIQPETLDNSRYKNITWTQPAEIILEAHVEADGYEPDKKDK